MIILDLLRTAEFHIKTPNEAHQLAEFLCNICPNRKIALVGMQEIFLNAIEHGNLGICSDEKSELQKQGNWLKEIEKRIESPEYNKKFVTVSVTRTQNEMILTVIDQGKGFDWQSHVLKAHSASPSEATHGRGVDIAKQLVFSSMQYSGNGNTVTCAISLEP